MQNTEFKQLNADTQEEHLDLNKPTDSSKSTTGRLSISPDKTEKSPQKEAKVKTRSRFSAALRSFSRSKSKKDTSEEPRSLPISINTEPTFSSGGEDSLETVSADSKPKKKSKLSRRFLLGGLRRSKIGPKHKSLDLDDVTLDEASILAGNKDQQTNDTNSGLGGRAASPSSSGSPKRATVQITISGKKIEPSSSSSIKQRKTTLSPTQIVSSVSETDYLTPLPSTATTATVAGAAKNTTKTTKTTTTTTIATKDSRTTKVIVSKVGTAPVKDSNLHSSPVPSSSPFPAKAAAAVLAAKKKKLKSKKQSGTTTTQTADGGDSIATDVSGEKIVITQSTRDTPPRERAPAKPSRVTSTTPAPPPISQTGAVRKPTSTRAGTSTTSASSSLSKHQHNLSTSETQKSKKSLKSIATVAATVVSSKKGRDSLQANTQQQRGHRLSRPSSSVTQQQPTNQRSSLKAETTKQLQSQESTERQIQLPLESHTLPPTLPDEQPHSIELQPTIYPPPPPAFQQQPLKHVAYDSVETATFSEQEAISSAESAQPIEYALRSLQDELNEADEDLNLPSTPATVRFAVGSAVRPQAQTVYETAGALAAGTSQEQEQPSSSDSQCDSITRRIRYQAQATLYGDHDSIHGRRETLHYHSVVSEYSNDSEDYDSGDKPMPAFGDLTMDQEMEPTIMTNTSEKREHLYKILVIGELGTGKTSFIKRYVHQFFSQNYRATIGVDFALKVLHWDANTIVRLQLWDIAGQERFGNMTRVYYKEAVGAFIVFDVTRSGTFDCVSKWKEDLDSKVQLPDGSPIPCILLANKCDQDKQGIVTSSEKMDEYVRENSFAGWFETSAKENINIDESARALVNKILLNDKLISDADMADNDRFNLNNPGEATATEVKSKCSC